MASEKPRLLSGIKPTGDLHIGNYFGALRQFVAMQDEHEMFVFIADYHALTSEEVQKNPERLTATILEIAADYLALGLDPEKTVLFKQSDVPEHTELAWIFNCLTSMSYLQRGHAYKDALAKNRDVGVGTFDYPMLMAADILLYDPAVVPVGKDQKQHVEFARDTAQKFNGLYGETFALPEAVIQEAAATIPGTDGRKMSKSYRNTIPLFGSRDEIASAVMGTVTDSSGERPESVYAMHRHFKPESELETLYEAKRGNYKALKEALIEAIDALARPLREKRDALLNDKAGILEILKNGGERARAIATAKMVEVRKRVGVALDSSQ